MGQETLAKLATYDGVKQQLRQWHTEHLGPEATDACAPGTGLFTASGERAGVITSSLAGPDGIEGLALVRRQALDHAELFTGSGDSSSELHRLKIMIPEGFVAPPVGAGGRG